MNAGPTAFAQGTKQWCRRAGSNRGPTDYESVALPLSYVGDRCDFKALTFPWNRLGSALALPFGSSVAQPLKHKKLAVRKAYTGFLTVDRSDPALIAMLG